MATAREQLDRFAIDSIPNLDLVVEGALELFSQEKPQAFTTTFERPLVMGSVNALVAAKIITQGSRASYADESDFTQRLQSPELYDGVVVVSASGGKHAIAMVSAAQSAGLPVQLVTTTVDSAAGQTLPTENVYVYPKNREPYTYNTSTYLGPILAVSGESAAAINKFIETEVSAKLLRNFADYSAVTFIVPAQFALITEMINTKFDELFGPMLTGRAFSAEEIKHAKTVVRSGDELFISLGQENNHYGVARNRLQIPLPEEAGPAALMAISYAIIGKIQAAHPPYFKQNIEQYCETATKIFGHPVTPIVN